MKQERSFSINSNSFLSGRRLEESILNDYKRVSFGQDSFYFDVEPLQYAELPKHLPETLRQQFTHCIWLENNPFYEVFTLAIFEYLLREPSTKKLHMVNKLKDLVCNERFLPFASYMKGLILKGLKIMIQNSSNSRPIGDCLIGNEKISAFTQCWKQMISESKSTPDKQDPNQSVISVLTTFFDVDIHFYNLKGKSFELQIIKSMKKTKEKTAIIPIILIPSQFLSEGQAGSKEESFSSISSIYGYWSYYILLDYSQLAPIEAQAIQGKREQREVRRHRTLLGEYPELFAIDQQNVTSSKISANQEHITRLQILQQGEKLLKQMKSFIAELEGLPIQI